MEVVSLVQATKEVNAWLDFQQISKEEREKDLKSAVNKMISAVQNGSLIINDDKTLVQKLKHPFGEEVKIGALTYKANLTAAEVHSNMIGVLPEDRYGSVYAHLSAATGEMRAVLSKMDLKDYKLADSIILFFMV